jgi:hypothetical protein
MPSYNMKSRSRHLHCLSVIRMKHFASPKRVSLAVCSVPLDSVHRMRRKRRLRAIEREPILHVSSVPTTAVAIFPDCPYNIKFTGMLEAESIYLGPFPHVCVSEEL